MFISYGNPIGYMLHGAAVCLDCFEKNPIEDDELEAHGAVYLKDDERDEETIDNTVCHCGAHFSDGEWTDFPS